MRRAHDLDAFVRGGTKQQIKRSSGCPATTHGRSTVFVRAIWRDKRLVDPRPTLREIGAPPKRNVDILGILPADFPRMTSGLFDRHP